MSAGPTADAVLVALGDPTRRRILELLSAGELPVGDIVRTLEGRAAVSQPAVSQHLGVLRDCGLVTSRAEGTRRWYGVNQAGIDAAMTWLDGLTDATHPFAQPMDALATEVARGRSARHVRSLPNPIVGPRVLPRSS